MKKVTVVGCGVMGSAIIRALMAKDFQVTIVDLNMEAAQPYIEKGAKYAASQMCIRDSRHPAPLSYPDTSNWSRSSGFPLLCRCKFWLRCIQRSRRP